MNTVTSLKFDYDLDDFSLYQDMSNRLFCTFTTEDLLEETIKTIQDRYEIIYNKIFVLYSKDQSEYLITYNVDLRNVATFPENTILVHRKKETRTLYTINALNLLIRELNQGILDTSYKINWADYRDSVLLTKGPELKKVSTKLFRIVE